MHFLIDILLTHLQIDNTTEASKVKLLEDAIHQMNPRAVVLLAPFGKIQNYTQLSLLLTDDLFGEAEMQRHRLLTYAK